MFDDDDLTVEMLKFLGKSTAPAPGWTHEGPEEGDRVPGLASAASPYDLVEKSFALFSPEGKMCDELTLGPGGEVQGVSSKDAAAAALKTWAVVDGTLVFFDGGRTPAVRFAFCVRDRSGAMTLFGRYQLAKGAPTPTWYFVLREAGSGALSDELLAGRTFVYSAWKATMSTHFTLAPNGYVTGARAGEHAWALEDGYLVTRGQDGRVSARYFLAVSGPEGELTLAGAYVLPDTATGAWHFLRESKADSSAAGTGAAGAPAASASAAAHDAASAAACCAPEAARRLHAALVGRTFRYENSDRVLSPALTLDARGFVTGHRHINETCVVQGGGGGAAQACAALRPSRRRNRARGRVVPRAATHRGPPPPPPPSLPHTAAGPWTRRRACWSSTTRTATCPFASPSCAPATTAAMWPWGRF